MNTTDRHIPALDGIRTLAILAVMIFHFFQHGPAIQGRLLHLLAKLALLGQNGVDLFFVLSGFLITGILLHMRHRPGALQTFYLRRTARIFPLYYAYLAGAFLLFPLLGWAPHVPWHDQWWFWFYAQNFQDTFIHGFQLFGPGHFWSLAVEEHFYLVWPFLVLALPEYRLRPVLFALIGLALATRAIFVALGYPVFYFTLCRMDALAIGALLALLAQKPGQVVVLKQWLLRRGIWLGLCLLPAYGLLTGAGNPLVQILKFTLIALVCAALLVLALCAEPGKPIGRLLGSKTAGAIAKVSYALYVFHPAVFSMLEPVYGRFPFLISMLASFALTGLAACASWFLLEAPILRLRDASPAAAPAMQVAGAAR